MAITDVGAITVGALLRENLTIPEYQRPYSWEPETALTLVDDIQTAYEELQLRDVPYVLGAVILHKDDEHLNVVDGQQRLLTLRMLLALLSTEYRLELSGVADNPLTKVWSALNRRLSRVDDETREKLLRFTLDSCKLIRVETNDVDEAFRVFDSQNYRGKPLAPHDLLKAHHLREMNDESPAMKAAVVEAWESVRDKDLDRLFSTYLYRIAKWSRGESAPGFTTRDIAMFKGISPRSQQTPFTRYHVAAQMALPMITAFTAESDARTDGHARFQLDAPYIAGRPFFEMVSFMLEELTNIAQDGFTDETEEFGLYDRHPLESDRKPILQEIPYRGRYRYVAELYLAALLYYVNKFGSDDIEYARDRLFAWAYAPRVRMLRVQFRTIDNRGSGKDDRSAFELMRNADSDRVLNRLPTADAPLRDGHEKPLQDLLGSRGAL